MIPRHETDLAITHDVIAERFQHAARVRRARTARRNHRQGRPLRPVGRLLVRLGIALGGAPEATSGAATLSPARPR